MMKEKRMKKTPRFAAGDKVYDKFAGNVGVVKSLEGKECIYYKVDCGHGPNLTCECDLEPYETATTYRSGVKVLVRDIFPEPTI